MFILPITSFVDLTTSNKLGLNWIIGLIFDFGIHVCPSIYKIFIAVPNVDGSYNFICKIFFFFWKFSVNQHDMLHTSILCYHIFMWTFNRKKKFS